MYTTKNKYGFEEKTGSCQGIFLHDRKDILHKEQVWARRKDWESKENSSGGFDIYKKNKYGLEEKVGLLNRSNSGLTTLLYNLQNTFFSSSLSLFHRLTTVTRI